VSAIGSVGGSPLRREKELALTTPLSKKEVARGEMMSQIDDLEDINNGMTTLIQEM